MFGDEATAESTNLCHFLINLCGFELSQCLPNLTYYVPTTTLKWAKGKTEREEEKGKK